MNRSVRSNGKGLKVHVAEKAGACYGVERALAYVHEASRTSTGPVFTLGPLIHNPLVVSELEGKGVHVADSLDGLPSDSIVVIRSHGVTPAVEEDIGAHGFSCIDATCPHVSKAHDSAARLAEKGLKVIVVGETGHPEVEGILAYAGVDAIAVDNPSQLPDDLPPEVGVVVQTTQSDETLEAVLGALEKRGIKVRLKNTICSATHKRQAAARDLASRVDVMLVIGGRNSGNTRRLYEICADVLPDSHHIESLDEVDPAWFEGAHDVGITAGASTPESQIDAVVTFLENL